MPATRPMPRATLAGLAVAITLSPALAAETRAIEEIVVTATASEQRLRDAPATMSVITRDRLVERPVRDVLDAVRELPGITLTSAAFTRKRINIRGMDNTHSLFLVDGRRVNASADVIAHSDFELGWIPTEAIERIEVVRGPMSSLYGSEALGGVINVITRPVTDRWTSSASASWGETSGPGGRDTQVGLYAAGPVMPDVLGLRVFVNRDDRKETPDRADPAISAIEGRRATSGGATLSWTPADQHRFDFSLQRAEDTRERNTRTPGPPQSAMEYTFSDDITRQQLDVHYLGDFERFAVEAGAYRSRLDRENRRSQGQIPTPPTQLTDDIAETRVRFDLGPRHFFTLGGEYRREELDDGGFVQTGTERVETRSLFIQDMIELAPDQLSLTLGARLDDHQRFGSELSPRAYLIWHASDAVTLRGGYGEGFKAPTLKQLSTQFSTFGGGGRFEITGNPDLQPETSRSLEIGALGNLGAMSFEATVFQNTLRDLVQTACFANCGIFRQERRTYVNVAEARIRGLETGASVALPYGFDVGGNYTYLDARDRELDARLAERPRHTVTARLGWQRGAWSAHTRAQRIGSQLRNVQGQALQKPHYSLWHAGAAFALNEQVTIRAGVENLFNERLAERSELFDFEERGRFVYLGTNLNF
ncbi:MAG: TonB-dependent receptor [Gammaproteobacteria bacterium]|nr:TonB-dependent receptor [Gammaproteobacteria bacterium]